MTASTIAKQLQDQGYQYTLSNIRHYVTSIAAQYGLEISKYNRTAPKYDQNGEKKQPMDYRTGQKNDLTVEEVISLLSSMPKEASDL